MGGGVIMISKNKEENVMKNIRRILAVLLLATLLFTLVGCGKYSEEAGVYECYQIKLNGQNYMSAYEYYRITLNADGTCVVESKAVGQASAYKAEATFSIEDGKISVYTQSGGTTITEVYDYVDGEIIMNTTIAGVTMYAKFARATSEK